MLDALRLHTVTHLRFYARSRLVLGLAVVIGALWSLGLVAFVLTESSGDRFDMLKLIASQLHSFAWFYTAAMGLFAFWWHTTQRTTTLVLTRPGHPELWLGSVFTSALLVAIAIHASGLLLTVALSLIWGIPLQAGFLWLSVDAVLESVIVVSVMTGLAAVLHPVLAILIVLLFSENAFYFLDLMLLSAMQGGNNTLWLTVLEYVVRGVHAVLPMLNPFAEQTQQVEQSLRVTGSDWKYLAGTAAYAVTVFGFWFLFADYRLRRRVLN